MGLPTDLLKFFQLKNAIRESNSLKPYSISDFFEQMDHDLLNRIGPEYIYSICQKFEHEGLLISAGTNGTTPLLNQCYYNMRLNEELVEYGSYDFLINGFLDIRDTFFQTVLPIVVQHKESQKIDIGTCFAYKDNMLVTARHCVENMDYIKVLRGTEILRIKHILVPKDENYDIAFIYTEEEYFKNVRKMKFEKGNILDEVLTLGYPPIAGFDAIQFSERGTISTKFKSSIGDIVGEDKSYLDGVDYFVINARVKGGNSGGPVINKLGLVVGMLVQIPYNMESPDRIDLMGFGIALPSDTILEQLSNEKLLGCNGLNSQEGFKITVP